MRPEYRPDRARRRLRAGVGDGSVHPARRRNRRIGFPMSKGLKKAAPGLALQPKSTVSPSFTVSSNSRDAISSILTCIR
jgi:hypothetical protein